MHTEWEIPGADGEPILGDTHGPDGAASGAVLITHGFLGYKDYGMFPRIARTFAEHGFIAHRYNLSHSGMTRRIERFERPDLFERDTWGRQVFDVNAVIDAITAGRLQGTGLPVLLFGHSRGGVTSILCAAGRFRDGREPLPSGVITAAAPATCCSMDDARRREFLDRGGEVVSNRTGQTLRIGAAWLREQIDDPAGHDVIGAVRSIPCPLLVIHGAEDPTVPASAADELFDAAKDGHRRVIPGANHTFNTPNPLPEGEHASAELSELMEDSIAFANSCVC